MLRNEQKRKVMMSKSLVFLLVIATLIQFVYMGANNLHKLEGTSTVEIVGNDLFFEIVEPEELKYTYRTRPATDFGTVFDSSMGLKLQRLVLAEPPDCCSLPDNAQDLRGNIALVERGECSFLSKTIKAEEAGALGIIIADNEERYDELFISMVSDYTQRETNIPATFLLGKNGNMIRKTLQKLELTEAWIRIPLNLTYVPIHKIKQAPWVTW